ncbi:MAG: hypothetical protein ABEK50_15485 [bacterium]
MDADTSREDLSLQFLVQEVLQDLGRYYERSHQRSLYQESLEGVRQDVREYIIKKYATDPESADEELDNIINAVQDQLGESNQTDTLKIKVYLEVFDEWCLERLDTPADEVLDQGTEDKPEARKWLDQVQDNVRSVDDIDSSSDLYRKFQNQLTDRWNEIMDKLTDL